jgi:hypothetical protein
MQQSLRTARVAGRRGLRYNRRALQVCAAKGYQEFEPRQAHASELGTIRIA